MAEALIVAALLLLLVLAGVAAVALSWETIAIAGIVCTVGGALLGLPTGLAYHLKLRALLAPQGLLPRRWWIHPVRYHRHLTARQRRSVLRLFYAGGVGFLMILAGSAITFFGVWLSR